MKIITYEPTTGRPLILGRGIRFWIITAITAIILLIFLAFIINNALVRVSYSFAPEARQGEVSFTTNHFDGEPTNIVQLFGDFAFIPRNSDVISAKTDNSETITSIQSLPFFNIPHFHLTLKPQRQTDKLGSDSLGCNMTNPHGTFSYQCGALNEIVKVERPDDGRWGTVPLISFEEQPVGLQINAFSRYKEGFITLQYPIPEASADTPPRINYLIPSNPDQEQIVDSFSLPSDFAQDANDTLTVLTDQSGQSDAVVAMNITTGDFIYIPNINTPDQYKRFSKKNDVDLRFNNNVCAMNSEQISCYYGPDTHDHDNIEEHREYREENPVGVLEITQFDDTENTQSFQMDEIRRVDEIFQPPSGNIYVTSSNSLRKINISDDTFSTRVVVPRTLANYSSNTMYYIADNGIYQYDESENTSYLLFRTDHLTGLNISTYGDTLLLNAFVQTENDEGIRNIAQIYQIEDNALPADAVRKSDVIPYASTDLFIADMDYSDSRIYVSITPAFMPNSQTAEIELDIEETRRREDAVRQKLREDGLLDEGTQLIFDWQGVTQVGDGQYRF